MEEPIRQTNDPDLISVCPADVSYDCIESIQMEFEHKHSVIIVTY